MVRNRRSGIGELVPAITETSNKTTISMIVGTEMPWTSPSMTIRMQFSIIMWTADE